jgi:hypothetical protein
MIPKPFEFIIQFILFMHTQVVREQVVNLLVQVIQGFVGPYCIIIALRRRYHEHDDEYCEQQPETRTENVVEPEEVP